MMDAKSVIERCAAGSYDGTMSFTQVVKELAAIGVESYRVDYRQKQAALFFDGDSVYEFGLTVPAVSIPQKFEAAKVNEAIDLAKDGKIFYPEFLDRTMNAGCIGYFVWIKGKRIDYWGKNGEMHQEKFEA